MFKAKPQRVGDLDISVQQQTARVLYTQVRFHRSKSFSKDQGDGSRFRKTFRQINLE